MDTSAWLYGLFQFAFFYPIMMAFFWISGGLYYFLRRERKSRPRNDPPPMGHYPSASLLIPCHNESDNLDDTIGNALAQRYPDFEVIAINDGSRDDTGARLDILAARHPRLRVIHLDRNLGKANALRMGALAARSGTLSASMAMRCWKNSPCTGWSGTCPAVHEWAR